MVGSKRICFYCLFSLLPFCQIGQVIASSGAVFLNPHELISPAIEPDELFRKAPVVPEPATPSSYGCTGRHWVIITDPLLPDSDNIAVQLPSLQTGDNSDPFYPLSIGLNKINTGYGLVYIHLLHPSESLQAGSGGGEPGPPSLSEKVVELTPFPDGLSGYNQTESNYQQNRCHPRLLKNGREYTPYIAEVDLVPFLDETLWLFLNPDGDPYLYRDEHSRPYSKALVSIKDQCPALYVTDEDGAGLTLLCDESWEGTVTEQNNDYLFIVLSYNAAGVLMVTLRTQDGKTETITVEEYRDRRSVWFESLVDKFVNGEVDHTRRPRVALRPMVPVKIGLYQPESAKVETNAEAGGLTGGGATSVTPPEEQPTSSGSGSTSKDRHASGGGVPSRLPVNGGSEKPEAVPASSATKANHVKINIGDTTPSSKDGEAIPKEIIKVVSALLNSGGGVLEISGLNPGRDSESWERGFEQKIENNFSQYIFFNLFKKDPQKVDKDKLYYFIGGADDVVTASFNCSVRSNLQVISLKDPQVMTQVLNRQINNPIERLSQETSFILGKKAPVKKSEKAEFKGFKSEKTVIKNMAEKIVFKKNKFKLHLSGMANKGGGSIYYGIDDSGTVCGELIPQGHIALITSKIASTIDKKMFWTKGKMKKGIHWDLEFREVLDDNQSVIPDTYVIIVSIAALSGGLFFEEGGPEAYQIIDGAISRMEWEHWLRRFLPSGREEDFSSTIIRREGYELLERIYPDARDGYFDAESQQHFSEQAAEPEITLEQQILRAEKIIQASCGGFHAKAKQLMNDYESQALPVRDNTGVPRQYIIWLRSIFEHQSGTSSFRENYNRVSEALSTTAKSDGVMCALLHLQAGVLNMWEASEPAMEKNNLEFLNRADSHFESVRKYAKAVSGIYSSLGDYLLQEANLNQAIAALWRDCFSNNQSDIQGQAGQGKTLIQHVNPPLIEKGVLNIQYSLGLSLLNLWTWQAKGNIKYLYESFKKIGSTLKLISESQYQGSTYKGLALKLRARIIEAILRYRLSHRETRRSTKDL